MTKSLYDFEEEWEQIPKDWFSVYHDWDRVSRVGYANQVAYLILRDYDAIRLNLQDLRTSDFKLKCHYGQCQLQSPISQFREDRFVRAMYNAGQIAVFERILDYQVPLKGNEPARHGDIDVLIRANSSLLIAEVKQHNSHESILKAMLQAYTYARLVSEVKDQFTSDFCLDSSIELVPTVITFNSASAGRQLRRLNKYPNLVTLLGRLNQDLAYWRLAPLHFFMGTDSKEVLEKCLTSEPYSEDEETVLFAGGFMPHFEPV